MEFKDNLKKLRLNKNMTQKELANVLYVSRSLIAKWENGLGLPTEQSLNMLCEFFNVEKIDLISDDGFDNKLIKKNITINKLKYYLYGLLSIGVVIVTILSVLLVISIKPKESLTIEDSPKITINDQNFYRVEGFIDKKNGDSIAFTEYNKYEKSDYTQMLPIENSTDFVIKSSSEILRIYGSYYYLKSDFSNETKEIELMWYDSNKNYPRYDLVFYDTTFGFLEIKEGYTYIGIDFCCEYNNCIVKYFCLIKL